MTTLQSLQLNVVIIDGPSREELFDALRLVEERRELEFTFAVDDKLKQLHFFNAYNHPSCCGVISLKALIGGIEPADDSGKSWNIKIRLLIKFCEHRKNGTKFFSNWIETRISYTTSNRKGRPLDDRFVQKCMRFNPRWDELNPGGVWFGYEMTKNL